MKKNKNPLNIRFTKDELRWRCKYSNECRRRLLQKQTLAEKTLYLSLETHLKGISRIEKQKIILTPDSFIIADFFLVAKKIVIELDGSIHQTTKQMEIDKMKDRIYKESNFKFIRVLNKEVIPNPEIAIKKILKILDKD